MIRRCKRRRKEKIVVKKMTNFFRKEKENGKDRWKKDREKEIN